jgi:hypothetical protein
MAMASDYQALSYADVVPGSTEVRAAIRWRRVLPLALLVPIVFAFGTPVFAFALLAAVLAAPVIVGVVALMAAQRERSAG